MPTQHGMYTTKIATTPPALKEYKIKPTQASTMQTSTFRFLDLPTELRRMIYERIPITTHHYSHPVPPHTALVKKTLSTTILATSRKIHDEASPILHRKLEMLRQEPTRLLAKSHGTKQIRCLLSRLMPAEQQQQQHQWQWQRRTLVSRRATHTPGGDRGIQELARRYAPYVNDDIEAFYSHLTAHAGKMPSRQRIAVSVNLDLKTVTRLNKFLRRLSMLAGWYEMFRLRVVLVVRPLSEIEQVGAEDVLRLLKTLINTFISSSVEYPTEEEWRVVWDEGGVMGWK